MNKRMFITVAMAIATTLFIQHYWLAQKGAPGGGNQGAIAVGQQQLPKGMVKVPAMQDLYKPLMSDISFAAEKVTKQEHLVTVETDYVVAVFSSFGGILKTIDFKNHLGKNKKPLRTIYAKSGYDDDQRKHGTFLLGLKQQTPYFYTFVERKNLDDREELVYEVTAVQGWKIRKIFNVYKRSYRIDMQLVFEPSTTSSEPLNPLNPHIFFMSPFINELPDDIVQVFAFDESKKGIKTHKPEDAKGLAWYWMMHNVIFGTQDRYFVHALTHDQDKFVQRAFFKEINNREVLSILEGPNVSEKSSWTMSYYFGPKLYGHLSTAHGTLGDVLSFGWLSWFCELILKLLKWIYQYVQNYGFAIILLSIMLRLPFVPLSIFSRRRMEEYQKHQPFIQRIRMKYKSDMQAQQRELMRYHQDHKLSPATPLIGCLPLLVQIPILFSLYRVLNSYLNLYQAPFFGWIVDLSAKDPFYVMPVLMGITMLWQQHLAPSSGDQKQKVIMWFMSIMMTVIFSSFPAGLVLYWLMNNILAVGEDYIRKMFFHR